MTAIDLTLTHYPDTAKGALTMLGAFSSLDLTEAVAYPDPQVAGVWKVTTPKMADIEFAIVYLAGHPDPWGDDRPHNDFECSERAPEYQYVDNGYDYARVTS